MAAKSSKSLNIRELFDAIVAAGLTPNQFYLLCGIKEGVSTTRINIHQDLRALVLDGWVKQEDNSTTALSAKSELVLEEINFSFDLQRSKVLKKAMGSDFSDMIDKYLDIWPEGKLPSGKNAREAKVNLEPAFKWFFDNHSYTWETILKATQLYEYEYRVNSYEYMRNSKYFIRKQQSDKSWDSELANYCERVNKGEEPSAAGFFSEKVV